MTLSFASAAVRSALGVGLAALCFVLLSPQAARAQDAQKTADYWGSMKTITENANPDDATTVNGKVAAWRTIAKKIDDLSARGVDKDAVEVGNRLIKLCKRVADYVEDYGDQDRGFKSGFRDGLNQNPTRVIDEMNAIQRDRKDLVEFQSKVRKQLESKYDKDFPSFLK